MTSPRLSRTEQVQHVAEYIAGKLLPQIEQALHGSAMTCINCAHFQEQIETCRLHGARPPARVIAFGCFEFYDPEHIPF